MILWESNMILADWDKSEILLDLAYPTAAT